ncbi:DUF1330 domain-containing protein [Streptomyces sp. NPDC002004]
MTAYAIGNLRPTGMHDEIIEYIDRVQSTLDPFGGRFLVHNAETVEVPEGPWPGAVVVIEFPDMDSARGWYASPAYQEILPMRTKHIDGEVMLVEGVGPDYDPSATAARLRAASS